MINFHISFSHERNRIIEKYFLCHLLNIWKLWPSSRFHWISKGNSLFIRSKKSGEVTLRLDSKPISVFCQMGDFGCGDGEWTPTIKIDGNKVKTNLRINSLLIQDSGKKRQRGWAKSAGFPWKTSRVARLSSLSGSLKQTFTDILLKVRKQKLYIYIYVNFRVHSITIPSFGGTGVLTTFQEARLALTFKRQRYRQTGPHPSPRSVLVWRSTISSDLLSSTSRSTLSTPSSLMGNTTTPHRAVKRGGPWLTQQLPYSATATRKGSMLCLRTGPPKQESVLFTWLQGIVFIFLI